MKIIKTIIFCGIIFLSNNLFSQDLNKDYSKKYDFYKPGEILTNHDFIFTIFNEFWTLSDSIEKELIKNQRFEVREKYKGEPDDIYIYYLDSIQNTIRCEYHSGGDYVSELRILFSDTNISVLKSSFSGTSSFAHQNDIGFYKFDKTINKFKLDSIKTELFDIQIEDFFQNDIPDSIVKELSTYTSYIFQIKQISQGIAECEIFDDRMGQDITDNKWIKANRIVYYYNNDNTIETKTILDK